MQKLQPHQIVEAVKHIQDFGYAVIKNFISKEKCTTAIDEINRLVDAYEPTP